MLTHFFAWIHLYHITSAFLYDSESVHKILVVSVLGPVLAYTLGKGCVLLVESSEQGLVFGAYALIGVSHHFSGNERLTVGKSLIMLGDLSLDVVVCLQRQ